MTRVLIVDDDESVRRMLGRWVERAPDLDLVGSAHDGARGLELARETHPDVVLTDIDMPNINGVDLTAQLRDTLPSVRVLALSGADDWSNVAAMIRFGAVGYLLKTAPVDEVLAAVRAVAAGHAVLAPEITRYVLTDLAEHYKSEHDRAEALADLDRMKRDFMNVVSHELRTPLTIISGVVSTVKRLRHRLDEDSTIDMMSSAEQQCARLDRMIRQVLAVSRLEGGAASGGRESVPLRAIAETAVALDPERVANLVEERALTDRGGELSEIITWIVDNALRFSDGPVRVTSRRSEGSIWIDVTDEGPGFAPLLVDRVLSEPFTQADLSATRAHGGLGISLFTAKRLLEAWGGRLAISAVEPRGAIVSLEVPTVSPRD